jgi:hypothetical protein
MSVKVLKGEMNFLKSKGWQKQLDPLEFHY